MKNCEVAELTSLVRAMATVPRVFFRPLSASLMIGSRVGLGTSLSPSSVLLRSHSTTLDHEVADDAMENGTVIETIIGILQKVLNGYGCFLRE